MELSKRSNLLLVTTILWASVLFLLGGWWIYLILKLGKKLNHLNLGEEVPNLLSLAKWEGGTFIVVLTLLSGTCIFLFLRDVNKAKSLQVFFSSLTHELKTPLASIRLQADVIHNLSKKNGSEKEFELTGRLIETLLNDFQDMGKHTITWDGSYQSSGMYFVRLESGEFIQTRKVVLVK